MAGHGQTRPEQHQPRPPGTFQARVAMRPQPQPLPNCKTNPPRTSLRSGDTMGLGGGARPKQSQSAARPHQGLTSVSLFFIIFLLCIHRTPFTRGPVRRRTRRTHDATAREGKRLRRTLRWSPLRALNLIIYTSPQPTPGGGHV